MVVYTAMSYFIRQYVPRSYTIHFAFVYYLTHPSQANKSRDAVNF